MLDQSYGALKRVRKSIVVIGGNTWTVGVVSPPKFIRWMKLPNGKRPRLDWFGHNPFAVRSPRLSRKPYSGGVRDISDVDTLHKEVNRAYPEAQAEAVALGVHASPRCAPTARSPFFVKSNEEQAKWVGAAYRIACRNRYIAGLGWYTLLDDPVAPGSLTSGLLDPAGRPKPDFYAYRKAC